MYDYTDTRFQSELKSENICLNIFVLSHLIIILVCAVGKKWSDFVTGTKTNSQYKPHSSVHLNQMDTQSDFRYQKSTEKVPIWYN